MEIVLAGTGPAAGFPVPGCHCASCGSAGPGALAPRRPAELLLRKGTRPGWRLDVDNVVHQPDGSQHRLRADEELELPGFSVQALGTGDHPIRTVLLVRIDRQPPLLWAPQAGQLTTIALRSLGGIPLAAVFLGPGPEPDPAEPGDDQPPLVDCALGLARLRAAHSISERTAGILVGVGHRQGQPERLTRCLAHWGASAPPDGTRLDFAPDGVVRLSGQSGAGSGPAAPRPALGGRTLVLGGSASGKSSLAEHLLAAEPDVLYTATGPVVDLRSTPDAEWAQRVSRHRERRPDWWQTEETHAVAALLAKVEQPVLLDSVGTWLAGVLDRVGAWSDRGGWRVRLGEETDALVRAWRARTAPLVAVSDETGWGVVPATASGRMFRDELGRLNRRLADESERVLIVVAGRLFTPPPGGPQ